MKDFMTHFSTTHLKSARKNMVDCQIKPNGVILPLLIEALEDTPRELFVPDVSKSTAYNDEDIHLGHGRHLLEPSVLAKMIQALEPDLPDVVLYLGGGTGYGPAILSPLVSTVMVVESLEVFSKAAMQTWDNLGLCNIASYEGALEDGNAEHAPYDSILINGAVACAPEKILKQLAPHGRLVCVVKEAGHVMGRVTIFQKSSSGVCSALPLFDAACPYLQGFEPKEVFEF